MRFYRSGEVGNISIWICTRHTQSVFAHNPKLCILYSAAARDDEQADEVLPADSINCWKIYVWNRNSNGKLFLDNRTTSIIFLLTRNWRTFFFCFPIRYLFDASVVESRAYDVGGDGGADARSSSRKEKLKLSKNFRWKISQQVNELQKAKDLWTHSIGSVSSVTIYPSLFTCALSLAFVAFVVLDFSMENIIKSLNLILNTSNLNRMKIK